MPRLQISPSSSTCPGCSKTFNSIAGAWNHINQPYSKCKARQDSLKKASSKVSAHPPADSFTTPSPPSPIGTLLDLPENEEDYGISSGNYHQGNLEPLALPTSHFQPLLASKHLKIVYHPHAGKTYSYGSTFLDTFNRDPFAEHRKENIYYPFASRVDWEVALFLLRSPLSKAEIDRFLKLGLVSFIKLNLSF